MSLFGLLAGLIAAIHVFAASRIQVEYHKAQAIRDAARIHSALGKVCRSAVSIEPTAQQGIVFSRAWSSDIRISVDSSGVLQWNDEPFPVEALLVDSVVIASPGGVRAILVGAHSGSDYIQLQIPFRGLSEWVPRKTVGDHPGGVSADSH